MQNFTAADLVQTTLATLAFAIFLLPPGYLLGLAGNLFGMRSRSAAEQLLFSLAFSFAATPILAVLLTRISSYPVTLSCFLLLALGSVFLLVHRLPRVAMISGIRRSTWVLLGMMLAWFLLVQFSLADLQIGHRLYVNYATFDHSVRVSFIEAAVRNGVPPHNPFYGLGKAPVLRYFYYWYIVCALPARLFGLSARACFNASALWSGLALASMVPLFLKHFFGETQALRRKTVIGAALLTVTGLDMIPYVLFTRRYHTIPADMEWWEANQVTSWMGSLLWVPHHVASLTACMVGLLALSTIEEESPRKETMWAVIVSGLAFASAAGLSVYVTFSFAVFMIVWTLLTLGQKRIRSFGAYVASGALVLILSVPYLQDLTSKHVHANSGAGGAAAAIGGERFAFFAIRDYQPGLEFLASLGIRTEWLLELAKLPMLLYVYTLEFGFFVLVLVLYWRRQRQNSAPLSRQQSMAWTMFAVCLLTMSIVKSDTSGGNDLGWRGMLVVQFVLLLWAVPVLDEVFSRRNEALQSGPGTSRGASWSTAPWIRISLICTLALGVAGTALQLGLLRFYAPLADTGRLVRTEVFLGNPGFGERTYWLRAGFGQLNRVTTPSTTVQYNPVRYEVEMAHLYSGRQAVMGDAFCGSAFGGDVERCRKAFPYFTAVFNNPPVVRDWPLDQFCKDYQVNVLVATDVDPVWDDLYSWVWMRPALVANPSMRAVSCGAEAEGAAPKTQ